MKGTGSQGGCGAWDGRGAQEAWGARGGVVQVDALTPALVTEFVEVCVDSVQGPVCTAPRDAAFTSPQRTALGPLIAGEFDRAL